MTGPVGGRPRIAVPARFSASVSALRYRAEVVAQALVEAVFAAGGEPLVVHPGPEEATDDEVRARVAWADALLLPGGGDLSPHWAGQPGRPALYDVDPRQDAFDLALARVALADQLPLLAVCRGTQVVNVALGGDVVPDMDLVHHRNRRHAVLVDGGSVLAAVTRHRELDVSCYHHQCLGRLGGGLAVVARADDGVVEAVELPGHDGWFLGVQWHPEDTAQDPGQSGIFDAFVEAARSAVRARVASAGPPLPRRSAPAGAGRWPPGG